MRILEIILVTIALCIIRYQALPYVGYQNPYRDCIAGIYRIERPQVCKSCSGIDAELLEEILELSKGNEQ